MTTSRDALGLRSDGVLTVKKTCVIVMVVCCCSVKIAFSASQPTRLTLPISGLVWRHGPSVRLAHYNIPATVLVCGSYKRRNAATQRTNATIVRADIFTSIRCGQRTKASYLLRNFLCHVNQDKIVIIVSGSEITQYIQIFSETTHASG